MRFQSISSICCTFRYNLIKCLWVSHIKTDLACINRRFACSKLCQNINTCVNTIFLVCLRLLLHCISFQNIVYSYNRYNCLFSFPQTTHQCTRRQLLQARTDDRTILSPTDKPFTAATSELIKTAFVSASVMCLPAAEYVPHLQNLFSKAE